MRSKERIEKVQSKLQEHSRESGKKTAIYIISPYNRYYLTGIKTSNGCVLITPDNAYFLTDSRYVEYAKLSLSDNYTVLLYEKTQKEQFAQILAGENLEAMMYEESTLLLREKKHIDDVFGQYERIESGGMVQNLRKTKDEDEIANIVKAQEITDAAFDYICGFIASNKDNLTESGVAFELEYYMRKNGAERLAFDIIAVSGEKSSRPHGEPEDIPLKKGFLTLDFGAKYNGYCTDMTRTVCIGEPTDEMRLVYNTVLSAQLAALEKVSGNLPSGEADAAARNTMKEAGYDTFFTHGLGHGVGLEIHEPLGFSQANQDKLPCGAIMTVEPGIYLEGKFGVRIEDIVVIRENGHNNLTKSKKSLIIL